MVIERQKDWGFPQSFCLYYPYICASIVPVPLLLKLDG